MSLGFMGYRGYMGYRGHMGYIYKATYGELETHQVTTILIIIILIHFTPTLQNAR